jgi:phosphate starvation-inducible membrane PsiE
MDGDEVNDRDATRIGKMASRAFLRVEVFAYLVLGILLALTALLGVGSAAVSLWQNVQEHVNATSLVLTIDRLLFVLMVVEILHTVRVSFRSGTLVCEPFLIVGLIASIRRVLVITLESTQASLPGKWNAETDALFHSTMLELMVLGGLILIMVVSICLLRYSERATSGK